MSTPGQKVVRMNESDEYGAIVWALKIWGDINENHRGGNALKELKKRIATSDVVLPSVMLSNRLRYLIKHGYVATVGKGHKMTKISIKNIPYDRMPPNPYKDLPVTPQLSRELSPVQAVEVMTSFAPANGVSLLNGQAEWSIQDRLQLINELAASVADDVAKAKAAL